VELIQVNLSAARKGFGNAVNKFRVGCFLRGVTTRDRADAESDADAFKDVFHW
jgi:hypothetical protein